MANNNDIRVTLDGDITPLQRALRRGTQSLDEFGSQSGGIVEEFTSTLSGGMGKAGLAFTGLAGTVAVAGAGIALTFSRVMDSAEKSFEVFQAASLSLTSLSQIQQMANMYAKVGLTMENVADQQKDLKDKLQDGLFNAGGSMYTDVIKPLSLNIVELQKMAAAGDDVFAKIYFAAKAQGYSAQQLVNMSETIGNDMTKRLPVLSQYNSEQEYQIALNKQTVQLTDEQSASFEKYRDSTNNLSNAWEKWNYAVLAPIADRLADILDLMTSIINSAPVSNSAYATSQEGIKQVEEYQKGFQNELLRNSSIYGAQLAADQQQAIDSAKKKSEELKKYTSDVNDNMSKAFKPATDGSDANTLKNAMKPLQTSRQKILDQLSDLKTQDSQMKDAIKKSLYSAYHGSTSEMNTALEQWNAGVKEKRENLNKQLNKDAEDARKKAEEAAKKAAAEAKARADKEIAARKVLNKAISDMTIDSNARQLAEFDRQQDELVKAINASAKTLGLSKNELEQYLNNQKVSAAAKRTEMVNQMIGYQDPNKSLRDTNNLIESGNLNDQQKTFLADQQNERTNGDNPFAYDNTAQLQKDNTDAMNLELAQNDMLLKGHEDYEKRKAEITAKYNAKAIDISYQHSQAELSIFSDAAKSLSGAMVAAFGESSGAAKAAFMVSRGITIAQTVLSIQSALAQALAQPFPASLASHAKVLSLGMSIISTAKGASSGQFHGGVDELPASYDNKSFVLKAGERVVQPEANKKLTSFLDNQEKSNSTGGDITINAPLIVQGDVSGSDAKFNEMLKKHANNVNQAVRTAQRRNT
nr:MAG TPA: tail tape measure [Caudoviricetes sp.]